MVIEYKHLDIKTVNVVYEKNLEKFFILVPIKSLIEQIGKSLDNKPISLKILLSDEFKLSPNQKETIKIVQELYNTPSYITWSVKRKNNLKNNANLQNNIHFSYKEEAN